MLPVPHLAKHSQILGAHVTFLQTVRQQKLDNYEYLELEPDQATQQDNLQFYIYEYYYYYLYWSNSHMQYILHGVKSK